MPDQVQLRGGSSEDNDGFTGVAREVTVDTTNKTLRVHDGSTSGGSKLAAYDAWGRLQVADPVDADDVVNKSFMDTAIAGSLAFSGALMNKDSNQTISHNTVTELSWQVDQEDVGGWVDLANNRFVVPSGVSRVVISGQVRFAGASSTGERTAFARINGSTVVGHPRQSVFPNETSVLFVSFTSPSLAVSEGDFITVDVRQRSGDSLDVDSSNSDTWFAIRKDA